MASKYDSIINKDYSAFNARDIDETLSVMHPEVQWSQARDGGYISGHDEIRIDWTSQCRA